MKKLLNVENDWDDVVECDHVKCSSCLFTQREVEKTLRQSKSGKTAVPSGVMAEMMKTSGNVSERWIHAD